jgi:hypothetical protein
MNLAGSTASNFRSRGALTVKFWHWYVGLIEKLPRPERNGFKGSIVMTALLFGLIAAPDVAWNCLRPDAEEVEQDYQTTPIVFSGYGEGGADAKCDLWVLTIDGSGDKRIPLDPMFCRLQAKDWMYISPQSCPQDAHCASLVLAAEWTAIGHASREFNFDRPVFVRIVQRGADSPP